MRRVVVFLKYPEPGLVKTRLASRVGERAAARLARRFAEETMAQAESRGLPVDLCFDPPEREAEVRAWLGAGPKGGPKGGLGGGLEGGRRCTPQRGADLGERMLRAFEDAFALGAERVALTGTDAPHRPPEFLAEALERLDDHGAALGPALDGGYHLIAMRRDAFTPGAFRNIAWSTPAVLGQTLDALRAAGRHAWVLPPWPDIDDQAALDGYLELRPEARALLEDDNAP